MIYLKNYWIRNNVVQKDYIDDGYILLTYIGLRIIQKEDKPTQIVSVDDIIEEVYGTEVSSPIRIKIIDSIFLLAEFGKIEIIRNIGKRNNKWELDISKLWIDTTKGDFTMVEQSEVQRLLQLPNRNRIALLRYYLVLLSTMTNGVGNQSLARIRGLISVSKKMQIEYNKLLEDENFIYIHRMNCYYQEKDGKIKSLKNVYSLPDKIQEANALANKNKNPVCKADQKIIKARPNANAMRSIKQKINNDTPLTDDEIKILEEENEHKNEVLSHIKDESTKKSIEVAKVDPEKVRKKTMILDFKTEEEVKVEPTESKEPMTSHIVHPSDMEYIRKHPLDSSIDIAKDLNWLTGANYTAEDIDAVRTA